MKFRKIWLGLIVIFGFFSVIWWFRFHPSGVTILTNSNKRHRVLAEARGLDQVVVLLCASDWPYTFLAPKLINSVTEGGPDIGNYYWSADESVIFHTRKRSDQEPEILDSAYDFAGHSILNITTTGSEYECHLEIVKLLQERGGAGRLVVGLPDGKNY